MDGLLRADGDIVVWWATSVESASVFARLHRDGYLSPRDLANAQALLSTLQQAWTEVLPAETVRLQATRLLSIHALRAADALQLSAALTWARSQPLGHPFVSLDARLRSAALVEGFAVLP